MTERKKPAAPAETGVAQWPELGPATSEHTLPTGRKMWLRRAPAMSRLIREGVIPSDMLGIRLVPVEPAEGEPVSTSPEYRYDTRDLHIQKAAIVCAMAADPDVTMEPLDGALLFDQLEDDEVNYIVEYAKEGMKGVATFLGEFEVERADVGSEGMGEDAE